MVKRPNQMVGRPYRIAGSDREALPEVWESSGGSTREQEEVSRPF